MEIGKDHSQDFPKEGAKKGSVKRFSKIKYKI